jgi:ATP-dependent Clp protease ATP-binding subunit ClpC
MVATASYAGLHRIIEKNSALLNLFDKVEVAEISPNETLIFLENNTLFFERKHKRAIGYKALREVIKLSARYLGQIPFPDRAMRLLDEAMVFLSAHTKDKILLPQHIQRIVSDKVQIPIGEAEAGEKQKLLNLEALMHQRLINQEEAVQDVSSALRRSRAEVNVKSGPIGSFLFLGPTGVGKTETAKALAAIYFGSEGRIIRLDMSEFQNVEDVKRFLGSDTEPGLLTTPVRDKPFSLVLLDELEKAHPNILNLFLQVLDEGWITDGLGRKVDFKNCIIIATSNAGAEIIRQMVSEGKPQDTLKKELQNHILQAGIFRPEFVNRFDSVVVFKPLSKQNLLDIAQLQLNKLAKSLADKGIKLDITKELKEKIVEMSYSPEFGAREMKRVLQDSIEDNLAKAMLSGQLKRGSKIVIDPVDLHLIIS